jgi:hypothetical protein
MKARSRIVARLGRQEIFMRRTYLIHSGKVEVNGRIVSFKKRPSAVQGGSDCESRLSIE